jgi:hypothetical protein
MPLDPPNGWERWRGATDERLKAIEASAVQLTKDVRTVQVTSAANHSMLEELVRACREREAAAAVPERVATDGQHVTFKWIIEKVGLPLLLAVNAVILALLVNHTLD